MEKIILLWESVVECNCIASLEWHWKPLVKVSCLKWFIGDCSDSSSEIFHKLSRLRAPCASRFHSNGYKYTDGRQIIVLHPFVFGRVLSGDAGANCGRLDVDAASVSGTVTSHAKRFPRDQASVVSPSVLLLSLLDNPMGYLLAGISAFLIARQICDAVRGGACSQSPACEVAKAFNLAWSTDSGHPARISL